MSDSEPTWADTVRQMVPLRAELEGVCGETFDHDDHVVYEDDEVTQWLCYRCGAEGWYDTATGEPS